MKIGGGFESRMETEGCSKIFLFAKLAIRQAFLKDDGRRFIIGLLNECL